MGRVVFKISVGFVAGALILLAVSLYLSDHYLKEQQRLAETGNLQDAEAATDRAARLNPFSSEPSTAKANLELRQGRTEAAAAAFEEAQRRDPANHRNYAALGNVQRQQLNDPKEAAKSYREALDRNPHDTAVVSRYAEALLSTGNLEGARAQYEWLRGRGKLPLREYHTLGKIQVRQGEPEEAIGTFEDAREKADAQLKTLNEPQKTEMETYTESLDLAIADALVVEGSYDEAREVLSQSSAEQASAVLALLDADPLSYRESVVDAPVD